MPQSIRSLELQKKADMVSGKRELELNLPLKNYLNKKKVANSNDATPEVEMKEATPQAQDQKTNSTENTNETTKTDDKQSDNVEKSTPEDPAEDAEIHQLTIKYIVQTRSLIWMMVPGCVVLQKITTKLNEYVIFENPKYVKMSTSKKWRIVLW